MLNKEMVGNTRSPTESMRTLKYFLEDAAKHKARVHQLDYPKDGEPVTPYMDIYKAKTQSDRSLDKLKLRIVVRGDL